ncbi:toxin glutamine deamidase domain-containing protein [Actinoallomurus sp. NPDC050550]|uniref:toxin glutamine deamidase domain-containing protein n=1 Tax=Actinoallomurus sp. NPDC050550 TaxID=3154937 RepID=UPI0034034925
MQVIEGTLHPNGMITLGTDPHQDSGASGEPVILRPATVTTTVGTQTQLSAAPRADSGAVAQAGTPAEPGRFFKRLGASVVEQRYPWLEAVDRPGRGANLGAANRCLYAAIAVDNALRENAGLEPGASRWWEWVAPSEVGEKTPRDYLNNYIEGRRLVSVSDYERVARILSSAGSGARGILVIDIPGRPFAHAFNVFNDNGDLIALDGQENGEPDLPDRFSGLQFVATSEDFPVELLAGEPPSPEGRYAEFIAGSATEHEPGNLIALAEEGGPGGIYGETLAENSRLGLSLVVEGEVVWVTPDQRMFRDREAALEAAGDSGYVDDEDWVIAEINVGIMKTYPNEVQYRDPSLSFNAYEQIEYRLANIPGAPGSAPTVPLEVVFPSSEGWVISSLGRGALIGPPAIGDPGGAYVHYNQGVSSGGLSEFLLNALNDGEALWDQGQGFLVREHLSDAFDFATDLAARFILWKDFQNGFTPAYNFTEEQVVKNFDDPAADDIRGYAALLYVFAAMAAHRLPAPGMTRVLQRSSPVTSYLTC